MWGSKMEYSSVEHLKEIFDLFIVRWSEDGTAVRCLADSSAFHVSLFGFVFVNEDRDLIWIAPSLESAQKAEVGVRFRFTDIASASHKEVSEALPEDLDSLSKQMERVVRLTFKSGGNLFIYELPQ
jgi:hypothetical protein